MVVTKLNTLAVKTPPAASAARTFAVHHQIDGLSGYVRRFVTNEGRDPKGQLESRNLGGGRYAHYELVKWPGDATEFRTREEAGRLHMELIRPGCATIVCIDYENQ